MKKRGRPPREPSSRVWKVVKGNEPTAKTYHPSEYMTPLEGLQNHAAKDKRFSRAVSNLELLDGSLKPGSVTQAWYRRKMLYHQKQKEDRMRKERDKKREEQENYVLENDKRDKKTQALNAEFMSELSEARRIALGKQLKWFLETESKLNPAEAARQAEVFASTIPDFTTVPGLTPSNLLEELAKRPRRPGPRQVSLAGLAQIPEADGSAKPLQKGTIGDIAASLPSDAEAFTKRFQDIGSTLPIQSFQT